LYICREPVAIGPYLSVWPQWYTQVVLGSARRDKTFAMSYNSQSCEFQLLSTAYG